MAAGKGTRIAGVVVGLAYLATAALHSTGTDSVLALARDAPRDFAALAPALWLVFSTDLTALGLVVIAVTWWPGRATVPALIAASLAPWATVVLQLLFIGFVPPTAILMVLGTTTLGIAVARARGRAAAAVAP